MATKTTLAILNYSNLLPSIRILVAMFIADLTVFYLFVLHQQPTNSISESFKQAPSINTLHHDLPH
jgi:hypothetical protein